jgi:uncharacterized protein YjbJ (UPF0337 family)
MTEHEKADQARKGLLDSVKGKAKEVVGAVIKNDELTAKGQVEQAQAKERKEANQLDSVADAETAEAQKQRAEATSQAADARVEASQEARAREDKIRSDQQVQKQQAAEAGARDAVLGQQEAEGKAQRQQALANAEKDTEVNAAQAEVAEALDDRQQAVHESAAARAEADRIRRQADTLSDAADVPRDR